MATRDDILVELGLTPTWRLREAVAARPPRVAAGATAAGAARVAAAARTVHTRSARIASLSWDDFAADVDACTACGLCRTRNKSVPGVGDASAEWLFVGEAPGAEEDARGEPFVGQAGRLLDNMLAALGIARGRNVYIANVLKCRPPNNRTPEPSESDACRPYLERQVELIRPKLIVALGKSAASLAARYRRDDRQPARSRSPVSRRAAGRDLSSRLPAAQPTGQGEGMGRYGAGTPHGGDVRQHWPINFAAGCMNTLRRWHGHPTLQLAGCPRFDIRPEETC